MTNGEGSLADHWDDTVVEGAPASPQGEPAACRLRGSRALGFGGRGDRFARGGEDEEDGLSASSYRSSLSANVSSSPVFFTTPRLLDFSTSRLEKHATEGRESLIPPFSSHCTYPLSEDKVTPSGWRAHSPFCEVLSLSATDGLLSLRSEKRKGVPHQHITPPNGAMSSIAVILADCPCSRHVVNT